MRKKFYSFDLLRVLSFAGVVYYHLAIQLAISGLLPMERISFLYESANLHVATVSVDLFFMLSGAGLYLAESGGGFSLGSFFKKRFVRILLPLYLVYAADLALRLLKKRVWPFDRDIPPWRFVFTLLGMDEYVDMLGLKTFTQGIGEWFLGCLVLMYLCYPLLRLAVRKTAAGTLALSSLAYLLLCLYYPFDRPEIHMNFLAKLYLFILGMCLMALKDSMALWVRAVCLALALLLLFCPVTLPVSYEIRATLFSGALFVLALWAEPLIERLSLVNRVSSWLSSYSYEVFLVHHIIIYNVTDALAPSLSSPGRILLLYIGEILLMFLAGYMVKRAEIMLDAVGKMAQRRR